MNALSRDPPAHFNHLSAEEILGYLQRFFKSDIASSPALKKCIDQLRTQYSSIEALESAKKSDIKKYQAPLNQWAQNIKNLKEGEQTLIVANAALGDEVFYLFSKKGGALSFKIVGRGSSMVRLSNTEPVAVAGQAKIVASLNYGKIDAKFARKLLDYSPLGNKTVHDDSIIDLLKSAPLQAPPSLEHLATKTNHLFQSFWPVFKQVEKNEGKTEGDFARTGLRLKVFTLFSLLQEYRHSLAFSSVEAETLSRMLRTCAQDLTRAYEAGIVSRTEIHTLVNELKGVQKAIDRANQSTEGKIPRSKMPSMGIYPLKTLTALSLPTDIAEPGLQAVAKPRPTPLTAPKATGSPIIRHLPKAHLSSLPISEQLDSLVKSSTPQQIVRTIYDMEFSPYIPYIEFGCGRLSAQSAWPKIQPDQAKKIMGQLNLLSKRLVDQAVAEKELSIDEYEALIKMSFMIVFLTHHINQGQLGPEFYTLVLATVRFSDSVANVLQSIDPKRYGQCTHPQNVKTQNELRIFYTQAMMQFGEYFGFGALLRMVLANHSLPIPKIAHLQTQIDLLTYLTPNCNVSKLEGNGSIEASIHGWIAPLPLPLLAVYHTMGVQVGEGRYGQHKGGPEATNRDTPEAIRHDPTSTLREFEEFLLNRELKEWRKTTEEMVGTQSYNSGGDFWKDTWLQGSPFTQEMRKQRMRDLLGKQEEYMVRASESEMRFAADELTALLSLLRSKEPQREVIAFIQSRTHMLSNPAIRSFLQLIFFHPSLTLTLNTDPGGAFCRLLPQFFAEKIQQSMEEAKKDSSQIAKLLFFAQMSERLKGIYPQLPKGFSLYDDPYDTTRFFPAEAIGAFLQEQRLKNPSSSDIEMIGLQLKMLLAKPQLSQKELCRIILDMDLLKTTEHKASSFDYRELFWIKGNYQELIQELKTPLDAEHTQYLLDTLCQRRGLALNVSAWTGAFPSFANTQYRIDLLKGTVQNLMTRTTMASLPSSIGANPLFRRSFPELLQRVGEIQAQVAEMPNGTKIYFFKDFQNNPCRIEDKSGRYHFYRSFPRAGHPELLQAATLANGAGTFDAFLKTRLGPKKDHPGFFRSITSILAAEKENPELPAILQQRFFIDPKSPLKGYVLSPQGETQLEVTLAKTFSGMKIKHIIDLRGIKPSEPLQLVHLKDLNQPALKPLLQIEDPAHILVWGKAGGLLSNGSVTKIELPRYGLQFILKNGSLLPADPKYAGYEVRLSATKAERKGFSFSLLLEHPDRSRPKKLILPPAHAIGTGIAPPPPYFGIAHLIWVIKTVLSFVFLRCLPKRAESPFFHIKTDEEFLPPVVVDLRPHTEEIVYEPAKQLEHGQALISHAATLGDYEKAIELIQSVEIEKEDSSIQKWIAFLSFFKATGSKAAVGLKISDKIFQQIRGQKKYEKICKYLNAKEIDLFKPYLQEARKLTAPLRLSKETFERISGYLKSEEPAYYQNHIAPFFLKIGDSFTLPTIKALSESPKNIEEVPEKEILKIQKLETAINPKRPIPLDSLSKTFNLKPNGAALLFTLETLGKYFGPKKTLSNEKCLHHNIVKPKLQQLKQQKIKAQEELNRLLHNSDDSLEQLALFAKEKQPAPSSDLLLALLQNDFSGLQNSLPQKIDLNKLKTALRHFYDTEVKLHLLIVAEAELSSLITQKGKMLHSLWVSRASALFDQLSYQRHYIPEENPELLAFEAFHFVTFRNSSEPTQLELLRQILKEPAAIVQAGTGSGKSSVLSVLRAFMRANGTNLVTQKVLSHLYQETLTLLQERLGATFKKKVYPFLFNQSMPLYDRDGNSLFERIYQNLLETIQNKGCVLTDYKSFVLLEEKFLAVSKQLLADRDLKIKSAPILIAHWHYLAKILILLKNRDDQLMDEFDRPLSAVQRIQTQLREGNLLESWKIDESLALYESLLEDKSLLLAENLQAELSPQKRQEILNRIALKIATERAKESATPALIHDYLIGKNENVLPHLKKWSPREKDVLAFLKNQFTTYLPLTLSRASFTNYTRNKDGTKIVPCSKGEWREAKFGNDEEETNYSIQDYLQRKIALPTFRSWILESKKDWQESPDSTAAEKRFQDLLPGISLPQLAKLSPDDLEDQVEQLLPRINQDPNAVRFFLRRHLESLRRSGIVVSMTPHDAVAMSRAVSGVSATTGSLGSLSDQFHKDPSTAAKVQQDMVARLRQKSYGPPIRYNPLNPLAILQKFKETRLCAIIDGSGAFRASDPKTVAKALLAANPILKKVDYYDKEGALCSVGNPAATLAEKGFYFPQAQTRGSDQVLRSDGVALLTVNENGTLEDLLQEAGRMRHPNQKILMALSDFASPNTKSLDDIIACKKASEEADHAEDRYRAELQRLRQSMRFTARQELFNQIDLDSLQTLIETPDKNFAKIQEKLNPFLTRFKQLESLFIQPISADTDNPGDYFKQHQRLVLKNADPVQELKTFQASLIQKCNGLKIAPPPSLLNYNPETLRSSLPKTALPLSAAENQQQEVEEELELNNQLQVEQEQEQEEEQEVQREQLINESKAARYLPRLPRKPIFTSASQIHRAFDPRIQFTDSYLPLNRTEPLHRRKLFDDRTSRIGTLCVQEATNYFRGNTFKISRIVIEDSLDEVDPSHGYIPAFFRYDIRTKAITSSVIYGESRGKVLLDTPDWVSLISQIKFIDGMTDGYTDEELNALRAWLQKNAPKAMRHFFTSTILKHRPESKFPHSQLYNLFEQLERTR